MDEQQHLINLAEAIRTLTIAAKSYAESTGQGWILEKYLDYKLHMSAEEFWQSSSADC